MSDIRKATAPMTGGMIWPPVEAAASTPPAKRGLKPTRLMTGMVKTPVDTTLATAAPDIVPKRAEPTTAACAGPPASLPVAANAIFSNTSPAPAACSTAPSTT